MRTRRVRTRTMLALLCSGLVAGACAPGEAPELVAVDATPTATVEPTPEPTPEPTAAVATPTVATPAPTPTPEVPALRRGVTGKRVRVGVIKSGNAFGDVEVGVLARIERANADGGVGGRLIELGPVVDDGGDPEATLAAARRLVEEEEVFAVVLASTSPEPAVTDYLAEASVPFFGWGFAPGFCEPNLWGFGFNGCLVGTVLGLPDARIDVSVRELTSAFLGAPADVLLVTSDDPAGEAAAFQAQEVWAEQLVDTVEVGPRPRAARRAVAAALEATDVDVVLLALGLAQTIELKGSVIASFDGMVVDTVSYLPGLLGDFTTADRLEGGYAVTQFPPQEEYRPVTGVLSTDLATIDADLIYSQAVSLGYWSADLLVAMLDAVGRDLDTATFHRAANVDGITYEPELSGSPCPVNTLDIHTSPTGGAALVQVQAGIYRPVVEFSCFG